MFVAVGKNGKIMTSPEGFGERIMWFDRYSVTMEHLSAITYGNDTFVAVGASGTIMISPDLWTWTTVKSGTQSWLATAVYARNKFIVVGTDGTILTSSDGKTWSHGLKQSANRSNLGTKPQTK